MTSRLGALCFFEFGQHERHRRATRQSEFNGHRGTATGLVRLIKVVGATRHHLLEEDGKLLGVEHAILIGVKAVENRSQLVLIEFIVIAG